MHLYIQSKNGHKFLVDHSSKKNDRLNRHINNLTLIDLKKTVNRLYYRQQESINQPKPTPTKRYESHQPSSPFSIKSEIFQHTKIKSNARILRKSLNVRDLFSHRKKADTHRSQDQQKLHETESCKNGDIRDEVFKQPFKIKRLKTERKAEEESKTRQKSSTIQYQELKTYYETKYERRK